MIRRKWIPTGIVIISYILIWLMLLSAMGMWIGLVLGHGDLPHSGMKRDLLMFHPLTLFYTAPAGHSYGTLLFCGILCWTAWLFSTRIRMSNSSRGKRMFYFLSAGLTFTVYLSAVSAGYMKHLTYDKLLLIDDWVTNGKYRPYLHQGGLKLLGWFLMLLPTYMLYTFWSRLWNEYRSDPVVQEWFENYKFQWKYIGRFGDDKAMVMPDITLALEAEKKVPVILTGDSRQLGTALIGPPGSGKTSLKIIKAFRQDLAHMQTAFNAFPRYVEKYGYGTNEFKKEWAKHLIGSIVIEPAKDLCDNAYRLTREHGIPEELVVYLDPTNPNTPGFNAMIGPLEQVAETMTAVFDGMSESSDEFFRQACRTVLKQYIYLLKFLKKNECTLLDLDRMYQDPRYTADMVEELEKRIPETDLLMQLPRDKYIFWTLADRTVKWFWNDGLEVEKVQGLIQKDRNGRAKYVDKQHEFTRQTRNLISDLITNPYLARILMGKNAVDLDRLMAKGGILLCNTAGGELGSVSDAFGKMVLMSAQNAVFRRKGDEKTRPLVSLYVDEFYDYMNMPFLKLTGQGRKYKIAPLVACQTLSQFDIKFGRGFIDGMLGTIRNYIVYGGVSTYDAEKLSPLFGMKTVDEVAIRESITPETMANPSYSYSESVTRTESELVTADQIMFNKFKFSYIRLVVEGSTAKAVKAEGDFVDFGRADQWKKALKPQNAEVFMTYWHPLEGGEDQFSMDWIDEESNILKEMIRQSQSGTASPNPGGENHPSEDPKENTAGQNGQQQVKKVEYIGGSDKFIEVARTKGPHKRLTGREEAADSRSGSPAGNVNHTQTGREPPAGNKNEPDKADQNAAEDERASDPPLVQRAFYEAAAATAGDLLFGGTTAGSSTGQNPVVNSVDREVVEYERPKEDGIHGFPHKTPLEVEQVDDKPPDSPDPSQTDSGSSESPVIHQIPVPSSPPSPHPVPSMPVPSESERKRTEDEEKKRDIENRRKGGQQPAPAGSTLQNMRQGAAPDLNSPLFRNVVMKKKK